MRENQVLEDEIELIDILRVLWKRKKLLLLGTLLVTLVAAGISFLLPKVYEATTVIEPGNLPIVNEEGEVVGEKIVEAPVTIKEVLLGGSYNDMVSHRLSVPSDQLPKFKVVIPKHTNLVKISAESVDPKLLKSTLNEVILLIEGDLQKKLVVDLAPVKRGVEIAQIEQQNIQEKVQLVKTQLIDTKKRISALESERSKLASSRPDDAVPIAMYAGHIQESRFHYDNLKEKLQDLQVQAQKTRVNLEAVNGLVESVAATQVHQTPTIPEKPIKPKKPLIVALAFMLGLMGTMMLTFLLEYLERVKEREPVTSDA